MSKNIPPEELLELLLQLKKTTPAAAKQILNSQPQIAYALISLMLKMNAVNFDVFQRTLAEYNSGAATAPSVPPVSAIPSHVQSIPQSRTSTPPAAVPSSSYNGYQQTPPPQASPQQSQSVAAFLANIPEDQKAMIMHVISMTPEQINQLGPSERAGVMQLRATLGIPI